MWAAAAFILFAALGFVALNSPYFYKQIGYYLHKPKTDQAQNNGTKSSGQKGEPSQLSIPSLGIFAPIVEPEQNNEKSFQEALKNGVVHYPGTAEVGQLGNAFIFGHSSDFAFKGGNYKTVFALLPHIQNGAEIIVSDKAGQIFHYIVTETFVASPGDVHLLDQETGGQKILTLQTSYPVGTALKRYIVKAKLQE